MKLMNIEEEIPEIFYIFIEQGRGIFSKINYHNYLLNKKLISAGFNSIIADPSKIKNFINGDICYAPFIPIEQTLSVPSSHQLAVVNGYTVEYALEKYRNDNFKRYPSRFSCLYAFGDMDSCNLASKKYKWDINNVKKFKLCNFEKDCTNESDILNQAIKVCKCNMEIITYMWNTNIQFFPTNDVEKVCKNYWTGGGAIAAETQDIETGNKITTNSDILYEYLIEGILEEV